MLVSEQQGKAEFTAHPLRYAQCTAKNDKLAGVREKQEQGCSLKESPGKPSNNSGTGQEAGSNVTQVGLSSSGDQQRSKVRLVREIKVGKHPQIPKLEHGYPQDVDT